MSQFQGIILKLLKSNPAQVENLDYGIDTEISSNLALLSLLDHRINLNFQKLGTFSIYSQKELFQTKFKTSSLQRSTHQLCL